jgi:type VI protein secretion system component VasK
MKPALDSKFLDSKFLDSTLDSPFQPSDRADFARNALRVPLAARAGVVNRTHRVIRERAKVMQERRSRTRSLMAPLLVSSVLLLLIGLAVWTGLYQYPAEATEAVQADVAALAASDANNQFLVVLLWFVPVSMAVLATVLYRRTRGNADNEAGR